MLSFVESPIGDNDVSTFAMPHEFVVMETASSDGLHHSALPDLSQIKHPHVPLSRAKKSRRRGGLKGLAQEDEGVLEPQARGGIIFPLKVDGIAGEAVKPLSPSMNSVSGLPINNCLICGDKATGELSAFYLNCYLESQRLSGIVQHQQFIRHPTYKY